MGPVAIVAIVVAVVASAAIAYIVGRRHGARDSGDAVDTDRFTRLEEYDFYPFGVNDAGHVFFNADAFMEAVEYFLANRNPRAAGELVVIGEQNLVRETFHSGPLARYKELYAAYQGDRIIQDNDRFLENYRRLVHDIGRSFPNTGIEILLHNLVNPSRSLVAIENGEVTGRSVGSGATNLVLDLKTRRQKGEDKVNYELNIGSRTFKCTTIAIHRPDYGLVGAVCINIDVHFIRDAVAVDPNLLSAWIENFLRTDFELDEMILSKDEYQRALEGKRHYLDEAIRTPVVAERDRGLAAIFFSDIVGFTSMMGADEAATMAVVHANEQIHRTSLAAHGGRLLKLLGDGVLASFPSVSDAVESAQEIQRSVAEDGRYQVRVGIHLGEVIREGGDVHGDGVNIASRIQNALEPGTIGVSESVYDNVRNKPGIVTTPLGSHILKGVEEPLNLFAIEV